MELKPGEYTFGPSDGTLLVKTRRAGAAFLVGKHLTIEVTDWEGKLEIGETESDTRVELTADGGSLKVTDGEGGPVTLTDLDKKSLSKTVSEKVLDGTEIRFHSESARASDDGRCIHVTGELHMFDEKTPLELELTIEPEEEDEDDESGDHEDEDDESGDRDDEDDESGDEDTEESSDQESETSDRHDDPAEDDDDEDEDDEPEQERRISARATFRQTDVGLEPHSTLLGLLKVRDEVEISFEGKLEQ